MKNEESTGNSSDGEYSCEECGRWFESNGALNRHKGHSHSGNKPYRDRDTLITLYHDKDLTQSEIGERFGVKKTTISKAMQDLNVPADDGADHIRNPNLWDEELVEELWYDETLRRADIAAELDCADTTLSRIRKRFDLPTREGILADELQQFDPWHKLDRPIVLYDLYHNRGMSYKEIGEVTDLEISGVQYWMNKHGFESRERENSGVSRHPLWVSDVGSVGDYGKDWISKRRECLKRDDKSCRKCGMTQREHVDVYNAGLDVHHITPLAAFDNPAEANELQNLIALCRSCHLKMEGIPIDNR